VCEAVGLPDTAPVRVLVVPLFPLCEEDVVRVGLPDPETDMDVPETDVDEALESATGGLETIETAEVVDSAASF